MRLVRAHDTDDVTVAERDCDLLVLKLPPQLRTLWLEIFLRDFVLRALVLPVNGQDPPAFAVVE
jgi:hypothetical protein